jgi:hypothetical protein
MRIGGSPVAIYPLHLTYSVVIAFATIALLFSEARAEDDTATFLRIYTHETSGPLDKRLMRAIPESIVDGINAADADLTMNRHEKPLYCPPPKLSLTGGQIIDMLQRVIRDDPGIGKIRLETVVLYVLKDTFPCPAQ